MKRFDWLLIIFVSTTLTNCGQYDAIEDLDGITYDAEYAIPIINSKIAIQDLLEGYENDNTLIVEPDGSMRFKYSGDVIRATVDQMFEEINDALPPAIPITESGMALPLSSPDGIQIDYMELKSGNFSYFFESPNTEPVEVTITMPQLIKDGRPLTVVETLPPYAGNGPRPVATNQTVPSSLKDYTIIPRNDSVYVDYSVKTLDGKEGNLDLILVTIKDLEFAYTEGFLGTLVYEGGRDTINIDFFDNYLGGDIYFAQPTVTFNIQNSFGIPTRSLVNVFDVFTVNGEKLALESRFIEQGFDFPYPTLGEVGEVKSKTFTFTEGNSNIDVILGSGPVAVDYDVDAITNPDGNRGIRGFITENSFYNVQVEVDLPLYATVNEFIANDTIDINFNDLDNVVDAEFKLFSDNGIPLEATIQGYFAHESGFVIDSLFTERTMVVDGAPIDKFGNPTESSKKEILVPYNKQRFANIKGANQLILAVSFSSTGNGENPVRINSNQNIDVRIGAKLNVKK